MAMASSTLLLAIFLQPQCWIARLLATRPLVHLGRISYGIYLFHAPLLAGLEVKLRFSAHYIEPARYFPVLSLLVLGSIGAAALHYWAVERRFLAMRGPRPFLANSRVAPSAAQPAADGRGEAPGEIPGEGPGKVSGKTGGTLADHAPQRGAASARGPGAGAI